MEQYTEQEYKAKFGEKAWHDKVLDGMDSYEVESVWALRRNHTRRKENKMTIELRKNYWVIHTDHYGKGVIFHTKQVMCEVWRDGKISEEPLTARYTLTYDEFNKAMDAYNWNEVLGEPEDYIRKETKDENGND